MNTLATGQIVDCTVLSSTFPQDISNEIARDALLNLLDDFFSAGVRMIVLQGKEDVGKTRLAAQFARRHPNESISVFIRPNSWLVQDTGLLLTDIATQMHWSLYRTEIPREQQVDESFIRRMSFELQKRAKTTGSLIFIVIDGIEQSGQQLIEIVPTLLAILPFEYTGFRFLITGNSDWVPLQVVSELNHKEIPVGGFTLEESVAFFAGSDLERGAVQEIHSSCGKGIPGYLASVRRLIESGVPTDTLLDELPKRLPRPFELEWRKLDREDPALVSATAILAHDINPHSVADLAETVGVESAVLRAKLLPCSFIAVPDTDTAPVTFVSTSFRRFASDALASERDATWELLIRRLSGEHHSERALALLPEYLEKAGRPHELIQVLSPAMFVKLAEQSDTVASLFSRSEVGLKTAVKLKRPAEAVRFGLQTAVLADVGNVDLALEEVRARMAVEDYDSAVALAQSAKLRHQRLQLMAAVAKHQREKGLTPEPALLGAIEALVSQVQHNELGESLIDTAADLMYANPELAIRLVTQATPSNADQRSLDWTFVRLSAVAAVTRQLGPTGMGSVVQDIDSHISDPTARQLSRAVSLVIGDYSSVEVLREVEKLTSVGDRLFMLRRWCHDTRHPEDAAPVIDYAVHLAIRTTEYTPTASDLRDLAVPLPHLADLAARRSLITAFDIQRDTARRVGPTQDYIALQLLVARAEAQSSPVQSGERFMDVYFEIRDLKDVDTRMVCTALLVAALTEANSGDLPPENGDKLQLEAERDFQNDVQRLLAATADHYAVTRPSIEALAKASPSLAMQLALQLNTNTRRDAALLDVIDEHLAQSVRHLRPDVLISMLGRFDDPDEEDRAVARVLGRFARVTKPENLELIREATLEYCRRARSVVDPVVACRAMVFGLAVLTRLQDPSKQDVEKALADKWKSIDETGARLYSGYKIVTTIANDNRELARTYLEATDESKVGFADLTNDAYLYCIRLAIRTYSGLLAARLESAADVQRLASNVERIPSGVLRVYMWTDLALRCFVSERTEDARRIVSERISPILDSLQKEHRHEWIRGMVIAAPALYESNRAIAQELFSSIPRHWRDSAVNEVIRFRLANVASSDPYRPGPAAHYHVDFGTCLEVLKLCEFAESDVVIYRWIEAVADSAAWKHNRHPINQNQKNDLSQRIIQLASKKFPSPREIQHEGFKILAEAQAFRLLREKTVDWTPLANRARLLPNAADRSFVLAYLAQCFHGGFAAEKITALQEAKHHADDIASAYDRIERYLTVANVAQDIDRPLSRQLVSDGLLLLKGDTGEDAEDARRQLVDFAYQLDPELASSLASQFDTDTAREAARQQIRVNEYEAELRKPQGSPTAEEPFLAEEVGRCAWDLLGQLNSGRVQSREVADTLEFIVEASKHPMKTAFPMLSFVVENALARRGRAEEAQRLIRDFYEGTMATCEAAAAVISRGSGKSGKISTLSFSRDDASVIVAAGERNRAMEYLRAWLLEFAEENLIVCDPYFGPQDLGLLQVVLSAKPTLTVTVITSAKHQREQGAQLPWDEYYQSYWTKHFSDQPPPRTEVVIVGGRSGQLPVHDRWWLSHGHGLRLGTSFNGLGNSRDSEISRLSPQEVQDRMAQSQMYLTRSKREHMGEKLTYNFFEL